MRSFFFTVLSLISSSTDSAVCWFIFHSRTESVERVCCCWTNISFLSWVLRVVSFSLLKSRAKFVSVILSCQEYALCFCYTQHWGACIVFLLHSALRHMHCVPVTLNTQAHALCFCYTQQRHMHCVSVTFSTEAHALCSCYTQHSGTCIVFVTLSTEAYALCSCYTQHSGTYIVLRLKSGLSSYFLTCDVWWLSQSFLRSFWPLRSLLFV
jgi:hypothetical protein